MTMSRREVGIIGGLALSAPALFGVTAAMADNDEAAVNQAVEDLRKAMLAADRAKLEELTADQLSYGHSGGVVETKAQFVEVVAGKKTTYQSITISEPKVTMAGNNAVARHIFAAEFQSDGKPGTARIGAMQVWVKQGNSWKLLARQAFRLA
jgi:ketosteroid isomerase-like protein